jgi:hypothetical protein
MAVATHREYDDVVHTGAASTTPTKMLRAAVGQDPDDNQNLPLDVFLEVEAVGVGHPER